MDPFDLNNPDVVRAMAEADEFHDYMNSPEHRLNAKLRTFDMSLAIFEGNFAELIRGVVSLDAHSQGGDFAVGNRRRPQERSADRGHKDAP